MGIRQPGEQVESEKLKLGADETWGVIIDASGGPPGRPALLNRSLDASPERLRPAFTDLVFDYVLQLNETVKKHGRRPMITQGPLDSQGHLSGISPKLDQLSKGSGVDELETPIRRNNASLASCVNQPLRLEIKFHNANLYGQRLGWRFLDAQGMRMLEDGKSIDHLLTF